MKIVKKNLITKDEAEKTLYGHKMKGIKTNVSAFSRFNNELRLDNGKTQIKMELIRISVPERKDAIKHTYDINGSSSIEIMPLLAVRDDEAFDSEQKLIHSFERLRLLNDVKGICVRDLLDDMCKKFKGNVRYAYREIDTSFDKNKRHSVHIYHIIVLFIACVSLLNDIDFAPAIRISITSDENRFKLDFAEKTQNALYIYKSYNEQPLSKIETKLAYLASLCREDDIYSKIEINSSGVSMNFEITNIEIPFGAIYSKPEMEEKIFNEYMELFNYTRTEEAEEE